MKYLTFKAILNSIFLLLWAGVSAQAETLTIAIVPQYSPEKIYQDWRPLLDEISKNSGIKIVIQNHETIPDFEKALLKGEPDLAYMNPYHAVMAHKAASYMPIIRDKSQRLTGILVIPKDSPIQNIRELNGTTIAFPAPNAFAASLYMRTLLTEKLKLNYTPSYVQTHSNVYLQVIAGLVAAGGGIQSTLNNAPVEIRDKLRIIYTTPPVFPHPIAIHPRIKAKVRIKLQNAFLALAHQPHLAQQLENIQIPVPGKADYNEYSPLEKLGVERFIVLK